jgi:hypothetical protein
LCPSAHAFHGLYLVESPLVAFLTAEACVEKGLDQINHKRRPDHARPKTENVHVVVLDGLMRRIDIVADASADTAEFVGIDADADPAAAQEDAPVSGGTLNRTSHEKSVVRVIHRSSIERAEVNDNMTGAFHSLEDDLLHREAGVIRSKRDSHGILLRANDWELVLEVYGGGRRDSVSALTFAENPQVAYRTRAKTKRARDGETDDCQHAGASQRIPPQQEQTCRQPDGAMPRLSAGMLSAAVTSAP